MHVGVNPNRLWHYQEPDQRYSGSVHSGGEYGNQQEGTMGMGPSGEAPNPFQVS